MRLLGISLLAGALFSGIWYWFFFRHNRLRALNILGWIEDSLAGDGHVLGVRWMGPSQFRAPLRLTSRIFHHAWVQVEMSPRQLPLQWLWKWLRNQPETIIFQADLDTPPSFSIDIENFRSFARSNRGTAAGGPEWNFVRTSPLIISSPANWQKEVAGAMTSLAASGNREFLNIAFRRKSPHFSVTLPLECIAPDSPDREFILDMMRELAAKSSAQRF
jgi:hypothetical protein